MLDWMSVYVRFLSDFKATHVRVFIRSDPHMPPSLILRAFKHSADCFS